MCRCRSCTDARAAKGTEIVNRRATRQAWEALQQTQNDHGESDEQARLRRIRIIVNDYLPGLEQLHLYDEKVALAYIQLAELHEKGYDMAIENPATVHCPTCQTDGSPKHYLKDALTARQEALEVHTRCWGTDNPRLQDYTSQPNGSDFSIGTKVRSLNAFQYFALASFYGYHGGAFLNTYSGATSCLPHMLWIGPGLLLLVLVSYLLFLCQYCFPVHSCR